jgi:hypothetical protein
VDTQIILVICAVEQKTGFSRPSGVKSFDDFKTRTIGYTCRTAHKMLLDKLSD